MISVESGGLFNLFQIQQSVNKLEELYKEKGFLLAKVSHKTKTYDKDKSVQVIFNIVEDNPLKVTRIRFVGNKKITDKKLKSIMRTKEKGFFSFISGSGKYKKEVFEEDIQRIKFFYLNEGFVEVRVEQPQVTITPDQRQIHILFHIEEGGSFRIGEIGYVGDLIFSQEELNEGLHCRSGDLFKSIHLHQDIKRLEAKYGDKGYAHVRVRPRTRVRTEDRLVDILFEIEKGSQVRVGRINISGNLRTRDKVIRREMKLIEGDLYNETFKRKSVEEIRRLGFFEEVNLDQSRSLGVKDKIDINVHVKERNTGSIMAGIGYSGFSGFLVNGEINQSNFMGKGQFMAFSMNYSKNEKLYNLNFTEPYFRDSLWSLGVDLYNRDTHFSSYKENQKGIGVRVGYPLVSYLRGTLGYRLEKTYLSTGSYRVGGRYRSRASDLFPPERGEWFYQCSDSSVIL